MNGNISNNYGKNISQAGIDPNTETVGYRLTPLSSPLHRHLFGTIRLFRTLEYRYLTKANQPKCHILFFYKKSWPQDFITRTFAKREREKWWFTYVHSFRISPWKPIKLLLAGMAEHNGLKDPHKSDLHIIF